MTDFYMRVDRPEHRLTWRFLDSDTDGADAQVTVSIPKREWMPESTFDKTSDYVSKNEDASIADLMLYLISLFDAEGHKWLKANRKKLPQEALATMWREFNEGAALDEGESGASSAS